MQQNRKYGSHWNLSSVAKRSYSFPNGNLLETEDFVVLAYNKPIVPRNLIIHQSSNIQGAIVQVWGGRRHKAHLDKLVCMPNGNYWNLLWAGNQVSNMIYVKRVIPLNKTNYAVNVIKIQLLTRIIPYYPRIGHIELTSKKSVPAPKIYTIPTLPDLSCRTSHVNYKMIPATSNHSLNIGFLPTEVLLKIFYYLDIKSLRRCCLVNEHWNHVANDPVLYKYLDLSPHWAFVNSDYLMFVADNFNRIQKLDLSNCNGELIGYTTHTNGMDLAIQKILYSCQHSLTHLCLENNLSVTNNVIEAITQCSNLIELRLKNTFAWVHFGIAQFKKLQTLDMSATHIRIKDLCNILEKTPELLHLIIDSNPQISKGFSDILNTVTQYNRKLTCWSSFKTFKGYQDLQLYMKFCELPYLEELDLGYCPPIQIQEDIFQEIGVSCPKIRRLILTNWERLSPESIAYIIMHFPHLKELDLRGCRKITAKMCFLILFSLCELRHLDINHCEKISQEEFFYIKFHFPRADIKGFMEDSRRA
ncbi:hypothetical protein ABEB36_006875 [Hypothenemus hampei]|uniref:F-box domain-containing protein n=1 Tax=Hypothenemus hampei TaxID=57062 RepID=A0ABD1EVZ5_HYPHA